MTTQFSPLIIEFKRGSVTDSGEFTGYASTFDNVPDSVGDIIAKGAFHTALAEHKAAGSMPALLWNHSTGDPVGRWLDLKEDSRGLLGHGKLTLETRRGREALALMKDQACSLSIGFSVAPGGAETKNGIRTIRKIGQLLEVSVVALPANTRAKIVSVKNKPTTAREFESALRDVGLSAREAKRATASGWRGFARDERNELDLVLEKVENLHSLIERKLS